MPKQNVHTGTSYQDCFTIGATDSDFQFILLSLEENTQIILIVNFIYIPNNNSIKKILNIYTTTNFEPLVWPKNFPGATDYGNQLRINNMSRCWHKSTCNTIYHNIAVFENNLKVLPM